MITIKLAELKEFFRRARAVKDGSILPIYQYFKLECADVAKITKTSGSAFITHELASAKFKKNIILLLEIKMLTGFVAAATGEVLTIKIKDNQVEYTDERYTMRHQVVDPKDFQPVKDLKEAQWSTLPQSMLEAISIARQYCANNTVNETWMDYVWVSPIKGEGKKKQVCVFATDAIILYYKKFDGDVPMIVMEKDIAMVISSFTSVNYAKVGNYHYYDTGNSLYGFAELAIQYGAGQFETVIAAYEKAVSFIIPQKEIIDFCDLVVSTSHMVLSNCYIEDGGKDKIILRHIDNNYQTGGEAFVSVEKKKPNLELFWFNPGQFTRFFKYLPYEKLIFWQMNKETFFVASEEDPDYVGVIRGLVAVQPDKTAQPDTKTAQ